MRWWPTSLFGRLLMLSTAATLAALLFAGLAIGHVLERAVMRSFDDRLDTQVALLVRAVQDDGTLDGRRAVDLPGFDHAGSGWYWQVMGPNGRRWHSVASGPAVLPDRRPRPRVDSSLDRMRPGDVRDEHGERLHLRSLTVETPAGQVIIVAGGPRRIVAAPIREAMVPLLGSLALLGAALTAATLFQLRVGLRPLAGVRTSLAEVRAGRQRHVRDDQPREIRPLVTELNALIDQNETGLANARAHVANLAHGLKTPLAALAVELSEPGRDPGGMLRAKVAEIDGRVRHHLGRARAAEPGAGGRRHVPVAAAIADLVDVMSRIHADRPIAAGVAGDRNLAVAIDPRDLDELLGNLLDNAWRHARSAVAIGAEREGAQVRVRIEDDGPGLSEAAIAQALLPGRRLDERGDGHGYGLPIARELAEMNGGGLSLSRSEALSGLSASVLLPAASG